MKYEPNGDQGFQLNKLFDNGITFSDNMDGALLEFTSTGASQTIRHSLGRKPIGFLVIFTDAECSVWGVNLSSWTNETLSLNTSVSNVAVRLFVL